MVRTLALFIVLAVPVAARADSTPAATETVIRMTVQPMPAPKPVLKYQLLPELREMNPGNPILAYFKCFSEQNNFFYGKESVANREKWETMPLKDLPLKEMHNYYPQGQGPLRRADDAARLDHPDWQILLPMKEQDVNLLLPDIQQLYTLAAALKVRFRLEVAERRFDDALVTARTMFALARHMGEHPTLLGNLMGMAVASQAIGPLEEMMQQPGCPNLYWALTDLPYPFLDVRQGLQGMRLALRTEFVLLDDSAPMSEAQLAKAVDRLRDLLKFNFHELPGYNYGPEARKGTVADWLNVRTEDEGHVRAARRRLIEGGLEADKVRQFPALQVVLLDEKLTYEVRRDEETKAMNLPFWQAGPLPVDSTPGAEKEEGSLFAWLVPLNRKTWLAQVRLERRLALLRCVEALRLFAAEQGRLPARLTDLPVPVPVDPVTGKPFAYQRDGDTARFHGSPPPGMEKDALYNVRYEVTIRK